jgi:DNA-binding GntR family transcriptional regulator
MSMPTQELLVTVPMSYRQIADDLADRIARGEYTPGQRLPKYHELADIYSVSRATASRAYSLLIDRGTVNGSPGRGVYVPGELPE